MSFEIIKGDLFDPTLNFDALAQGVNTYGVMGAGIAVPFRKKFPDMFTDYQRLCNDNGAYLGGLVHIWNPEPEVEVGANDEGIPNMILDFGTTIYNLFTQIKPGPDADYKRLRTSLILMRQDAELALHSRVGLPWIGCGIGGLERHNVSHIMSTVLGPSGVEFVLVEQE